MPRLIDAYKLEEIIDEWLDTVGTVVVGKGLSYYGELYGCIEDCPTIDPVKHGHWDLEMVGMDHDIRGYSCSECGFCLPINPRYLPNYCENCGALMDEERTDENAE